MSTMRANTFLDSAGGNTATINGGIPLEQGGGVDMGTNKVRIGWASAGTGLLAQVDSAPIGRVITNTVGTSLASSRLSAPGDAPIYACRAWVNFNGTGTVAIRGSGNVSSITDNGTGDYTVNFATVMPDANYGVVLGCRNEVAAGDLAINIKEATTPTTSAVRVQCSRAGAGNTDSAFVNVAIFR